MKDHSDPDRARCTNPVCVAHTHGTGSIQYLRAKRDLAHSRAIKLSQEAEHEADQERRAAEAIASLPCDAKRTDQELIEHLTLQHKAAPNPDLAGHRSRLDQIHASLMYPPLETSSDWHKGPRA